MIEPNDVVSRFIQGWERLDSGMILGTFAKDMTLVWGTDEDEVWRTTDEISAAVDRQVKAFSHPRYVWGPGDPTVLNAGELSVVAGVLNVSVESEGSVHETAMRSTFVVRGGLSEGAIVHAHFSVGSELPAAPY